jgi:hypothetical protein
MNFRTGPDREALRSALCRNADGSWTCLSAVTLPHPGGRIELAAGTRLERGRRFMGVDLAAWLEEKLGPG